MIRCFIDDSYIDRMFAIQFSTYHTSPNPGRVQIVLHQIDPALHTLAPLMEHFMGFTLDTIEFLPICPIIDTIIILKSPPSASTSIVPNAGCKHFILQMHKLVCIPGALSRKATIATGLFHPTRTGVTNDGVSAWDKRKNFVINNVSECTN